MPDSFAEPCVKEASRELLSQLNEQDRGVYKVIVDNKCDCGFLVTDVCICRNVICGKVMSASVRVKLTSLKHSYERFCTALCKAGISILLHKSQSHLTVQYVYR